MTILKISPVGTHQRFRIEGESHLRQAEPNLFFLSRDPLYQPNRTIRRSAPVARYAGYRVKEILETEGILSLHPDIKRMRSCLREIYSAATKGDNVTEVIRSMRNKIQKAYHSMIDEPRKLEPGSLLLCRTFKGAGLVGFDVWFSLDRDDLKDDLLEPDVDVRDDDGSYEAHMKDMQYMRELTRDMPPQKFEP